MTRSVAETIDVRSRVQFTVDDAQQAADRWGFNCGPAALCAVLGKTPDEIRPHLGDFERKGYTNPTLMASILRGLGVQYRSVFSQPGCCHRNALRTPHYPRFGLVRIQWDGPWCDPGRPAVARYRHTHWTAMGTVEPERSRSKPGPKWPDRLVFDVNAVCVGGWLPSPEWESELVPWLLRQCLPRANGQWWPTHCWEIEA